MILVIEVDGKVYMESINNERGVICRGCAFDKEINPKEGRYNRCTLPSKYKLTSQYKDNILSFCPFIGKAKSVVFKEVEGGI